MSTAKMYELLKAVGFVVLFATLVPPAAFAENQAGARLGRTVFLQHCAPCHGADARGNAAVAAALHTTIPDYRSERVQSLRDVDFRTVVNDGWGKMPPVPNLSSQDVENLIAYIRTFGARQHVEVGQHGLPARGEELFSGRIPFANGGPACATCHNIQGMPFPGGGTMGPDLTQVYSRLGPQGLETALETKYFPTMTPLYHPHPLTLAERADLKAFLEAANAEPLSPDITPAVFAIALAGFVVLIMITWLLWRGRLRGVRHQLVERTKSTS